MLGCCIGYATLTRRIYNPTVRAVSRSRALFHVCPCPTDSPHTHIFIHQDAQTKHTRRRPDNATANPQPNTATRVQATAVSAHIVSATHPRAHIVSHTSACEHDEDPRDNMHTHPIKTVRWRAEGRGIALRAAHAILRDAQPVQACRRAPSAIRLECIAHRLRLGSKRLLGGGPAPPSRALGRPLPLGRGRFRSGPPASRASVGRRGLLSAGVAFSRPAWRG